MNSIVRQQSKTKKGVKMRQFVSISILLISVILGSHFPGGAALCEAEPPPKVYLNHFFLTLDAQTYKDIEKSDFIKKEFAFFEERTTVVNNEESYSGAYIYGENTYFEFFDESKSQDSSTTGLTSAIAFGVEKKDGIKTIQNKLKDYKNGYMALRTRELNGVQIPWFTMAAVFYGNHGPDVTTWVMEYHEDFLKKWHPELLPETPGIRRKDILKRYAAKIEGPGLLGDKILKDVIEVYIRLNPEDLKMLKEELSVLGFAYSREGNKTKCSGTDVSIVIDPIDGVNGKITGIKMSCRPHKYIDKTFVFGKKSRLALHEDKTAIWTFE
jgi:hypothetical protein